MNYFSFGRFNIPVALISAVMAILISSLLYKWKFNKQPGNWYLNSYLWYFLIYKLAYIPFNFSLFVKYPFSLLYFDGGTKGQIMAAAAGAIYIFRSYQKNPPLIYMEIAPLYLLNFFIFQTIECLFINNAMAGLVQLILFLGLAFLFYRMGSHFSRQVFLVIFLIEFLSLSLFSQISISFNISFILIGFFLTLIQYYVKEDLKLEK